MRLRSLIIRGRIRKFDGKGTDATLGPPVGHSPAQVIVHMAL